MTSSTTPESGAVSFRPLGKTDFTAMTRWLSDTEVAQWWPKDDLSLTAIAAKYQPIVDGTEPVRGYVIRVHDEDIGYIQAYRISDHPDYARQLDVPAGAVATDLFIGDSAWRGRGWGTVVICAFLQQVVFGHYDAALAIIAPTPSNTRAIRSYERCGFRWHKTVAVIDEEDPLECGDEYVMVMAREDFTVVGGASHPACQ